MYETFIEANRMERVVLPPDVDNVLSGTIGQLFEECAGASFRNGLYRMHTFESSVYWVLQIKNAYKQSRGNFIPFAYDWMGRQFVLDKDRENVILLFDAATMKYFDIGQSLTAFHNHLLISERDEVLSEVFFLELLSFLGKDKLDYKQCIGHKRPLFLGGTDDRDNFQITSIEVYWDFQYQIYEQIKDLPDGTRINEIKYLPK